MRKITGIYSLRKIHNEVFRDVVYEWEDDISEIENANIIRCSKNTYELLKSNSFKKLIYHVLKKRKKKDFKNKDDIKIGFVVVYSDFEYIVNKSCIPVFLDIGLGQVDEICHRMGDNPFVVTILDIFNVIKKKYSTSKCIYMPLMISSRWAVKSSMNRKIDLVQPGRKNDLLHSYAIRFVNEYPEYEYVYSGPDGTTGELKYYSTKERVIENVLTREQYINLLSESKICILSSPGIDNCKSWIKGIDFPTPRFYEAPILHCNVIARYTENEEFSLQKINSICKSIKTYEDFKSIALRYLRNKTFVSKDIIQEYNDMHTVKPWVEEFLKKLDGVL